MELHQIIFEEIALDQGTQGHSPKKFTCPGCSKKRFVRYLNIKTREYLPDIYGRCDREQGCAYMLSPFEDIKEAKKAFREHNPNYRPPERPRYETPIRANKERATVPRETMYQTFQQYEIQPLFQWFKGKFGNVTAMEAFKTFNVGTAKDGSTLFWQVDKNLNVRTCQKIIYTGYNRDKQTENSTVRLFKVDQNYEPCLFGEHLLHIARKKNIDPVVCLVESEKTAVICQIYMPTIPTKSGERMAVWLASSGSNGLTDAKISVLKDYDVILYPDFSYLNRAQWGLVPMRKSKRIFQVHGKEVERLVPDPNGEIDPLYVSAKERILNFAKARRCYVIDVQPERIDGGDIADFLTEGGPPVIVPIKPEFNKYRLNEHNGATVARELHKTENAHTCTPGLNFGQPGWEKQEMDKLCMKNPALGMLITSLELQLVSVQPTMKR